MNLSPDPQLATSTMDYDALLLKETKTNKDLKSRFEELKEDNEELKESHKLLINQLVKHKIIKAEEWEELMETGDISSLKKYEDLKEENAMLKDGLMNALSIRDEYEKEMCDIKIAMGCDGPLSWDIKDILRWIMGTQEKLESAQNAADAFYWLVDKNRGSDNLNFGERAAEEIAKLKEENETLKERIQSAGERQREDFDKFLNNFKEAAKEIADLKEENKKLARHGLVC
jgi:FtsZ-binding cell division protein ZapB